MKPILDLVQQKQVCEIVAIGGSLKMAAAMVGCTKRAIRNTAEHNPEFRSQLDVAELNVALVCIKTLREAAREPKHWRAAVCLMDILEPVKELINSKCKSPRANRAPLRQPKSAARRHFHIQPQSLTSKKPQESSGDFQ